MSQCTQNTKINYQQFQQRLTVSALKVPTQLCGDFIKKFKEHAIKIPKLRGVAQTDDQNSRLVLLSQLHTAPEWTESQQQMIDKAGAELTTHTVELDYQHYSIQDAFKVLLPAGLNTPHSFETVDHICHLNLRDEQLPYKHIIGQVILDKLANIKTVVNKVGVVSNEYRVFDMELLAGQPNWQATVSTCGCQLSFDYSKVFWNSRLENEHMRLVSLFQPGEVVLDCMAGVGPFAVPAGKKKCVVYANDLNPASAQYLASNIASNRVHTHVAPYCMDANAFIHLITTGCTGSCSGPCDATCAPRCTCTGVCSGQCVTPGSDHEQGTRRKARAPDAEHSKASNSEIQKRQEGDADAAGSPLVIQDAAAPPQECAAAAAPPGAAAAAQGGPPAPPPSDREATEGASIAQSTQPTQKSGGKRSSARPAKQAPRVPYGCAGSDVCPPRGGVTWQHAVMNLPASALSFLRAFRACAGVQGFAERAPIIHVYFFTPSTCEKAAITEVEKNLGASLDITPNVHIVRHVAPNKHQVCVSFALPQSVI